MKILELKNVTFATNKHYNSLQNVNLELQKGDKALVFAGYDSGIVEFFRVVLGFEKGFDGEIKYKETDVKKLKYKDSKILYIPKQPVFFENKSLEYNIKYFLKLREKNKLKIKENFEEIIKEYDFKDLIEEKVKFLNKIEKLKLCFARSSFREIDLILLEDIFDGLTKQEIELILKLLKDFVEKHDSTTLIWVSNEKLIENLEGYKKFKLEYGLLDIMP